MNAWIKALTGPLTGESADTGKVALVYCLVGIVGYKLLNQV